MLVLELFQGIYTLFLTEPAVAFARLGLIALGLLFVFLSYKKILEPLIMLPMGIGMIAVNGGLMVMEAETMQLGNLFLNPLAGNVEELMFFLQIDFLQPIYTFTFSNGLIACLVFMGIGAITDIDILLARPYMSFFLAICAELGTIVTLPIAMAMGLLRASSWRTRSWLRFDPVEVLEIRKPDDVEIISAGIWLTSPSPTASMANVLADWAAVMLRIMPTRKPPTRLTAVMISPAMASPRMNLLAPSMAP